MCFLTARSSSGTPSRLTPHWSSRIRGKPLKNAINVMSNIRIIQFTYFFFLLSPKESSPVFSYREVSVLSDKQKKSNCCCRS